MDISTKIIKDFSKLKIKKNWSFADKKKFNTSYATHSYHRYPAKFIPQIVSNLLEDYTQKNDLILDPFGGCGTTLVESKLNGRKSIGVDINPVAILIAKVKTTQINPFLIDQELERIKVALKQNTNIDDIELPKHERIDFWFKEGNKIKLAQLLNELVKIKNQDIKDFFFCGFSNILKDCSIWLQKSTKPTRDLQKKDVDPFQTFFRQIERMNKGNRSFYEELEKKQNLSIRCDVKCADARSTGIRANTVNTIITSPPYVTSYSYADLHQLSTLWFQYAEDLSKFRKSFIGSYANKEEKTNINSNIGEQIINELYSKEKSTAAEVSTYFNDMNKVYKEMNRVLKEDGRACIVIGNTTLRKVEILNAEVTTEQLINNGFQIENIIKREIPSRNLPYVRDEKTGKFTSLDNKSKTFVYPVEYIVVARKAKK